MLACATADGLSSDATESAPVRSQRPSVSGDVKPPETTILIAVKGSHIAIGSRGILVGRIGDAQGGIPALPCYE